MTDKYASKIETAYKNINDEFNSAISQSPSILKNSLNRVILKGKFYELNSTNDYANYIYQSISVALKSDWYQSVTEFTQRQISTSLKFFILWLNEQKINDSNKYSILKEFETHRVNIIGVKPQSTGLNSIITLIKQGMNEIDFDNEIYVYLNTLILRTNISKFDPPIPDTLTNFFSSISWLRNEIGDDNFQKLESPKRLINSFSVTIATILFHILNIKQEAKSTLKHDDLIKNDETLNNRANRQIYTGNLFAKLSKFDNNFQPVGHLTELMILDFVPKKNIEKLSILSQKGFFNPHNDYRYNLNKNQIFTKPNIFSPGAWEAPSEIEQVLFAWLCAWQTIQPYDVAKLKKNDFIITRNNQGRTVSVQCTYYKGRSGRKQEPPMLDSRQIEAKAIISYLDYFPNSKTHLIDSINIAHIQLTFGRLSITERLINLINCQAINELIFSNLWKRRANPIFIKSFIALNNKKEFTFIKWINKLKIIETKKSGFTINEYKKSTLFPLPAKFFGLNAIKNTAVHANTDRYREADLINQNSHTSETEKTSYLTDANKDWVNQNGRITRLVLHDIEKYVYKPNLDQARKDAHEMSLRTKVIKVLDEGISDSNKVKINSIGQVNYSKEIYIANDADADEIIVLDTEETVVTMLHYINEAVAKQSLLMGDAITYFERTVLPTVEWMEYILTCKLSAPVIKQGNKKYEEIKNILPQLFLNEIRGGLGI